MKHYKLNNLIGNLQKVRMTEDEKSEVLMRSWSAIEKIEAVHAMSARTSRIAEVGQHKTSVASSFQTAWYSYFMEKKFVPALSLALLLIATGGTSLFAESALPGDLLYPVKLGLNEQVRGLTAITPEAKAKFALEVTDRRLKEVALLSSKGLLNAETSSVIQTELLKQAGQIKNQVASLVSTNNIRSAQEISLNFESSLRAHELILEKISSKNQNASDDVVAVAMTMSVVPDSVQDIDASSTDSIEATSTGSTTIISPISPTALTAKAPAIKTAMSARASDNIHITSLIATIKAQIATTTAARAVLQALEAGDTLDKDKLLTRLSEIKLKTVEIKRIVNSTGLSSTSTRFLTSISYINESDNLVVRASRKIASSSYSGALLDLQKASEYLIDAETLISAEFTSDPSLEAVIDEALSQPHFSQLDTASTTPGSDSSVNASSTLETPAIDTASTTSTTTPAN